MRTGLILTAAPDEEPIGVPEVKRNIRLTTSKLDTLLSELIAWAVARVDGPNGLINRALITQTWRATYDRFPAEITIPLARCQSVDGIAYIDAAGDAQTLAPELYRVTGINTDLTCIRPVTGSWPQTKCDREALSVEFTSGFGDEPEDVPGSIRHALIEMVSDAFSHPQSTAPADSVSPVPYPARNALIDWIVYPIA